MTVELRRVKHNGRQETTRLWQKSAVFVLFGLHGAVNGIALGCAELKMNSSARQRFTGGAGTERRRPADKRDPRSLSRHPSDRRPHEPPSSRQGAGTTTTSPATRGTGTSVVRPPGHRTTKAKGDSVAVTTATGLFCDQ